MGFAEASLRDKTGSGPGVGRDPKNPGPGHSTEGPVDVEPDSRSVGHGRTRTVRDVPPRYQNDEEGDVEHDWLTIHDALIEYIADNKRRRDDFYPHARHYEYERLYEDARLELEKVYLEINNLKGYKNVDKKRT